MVEGLKEGKEFLILGYENEENPVIQKLRSMGLKEGKRAKILMKNGRVYLLKVDNTRIVIDKNLFDLLKKEAH
ncbi:FeoA family protein [Aquifex aeolicus]|uniref:FeoA family protein n=1 Tax=Aquifex aeolicus TaxID=63363 RepID=UPI000302B882|nr:FeoA family protein [Aquifex aeolicus]